MKWRGAVAGLLLAATAQAAEPLQPVAFDSLDGTPLRAWLLMPDGAPRGTVVALHGCGGLYATSGPRGGLLNARHAAMGEMLAADGYAVLFPDSLRPRGETQLCTQKIGQRSIDQSHRRADALAALAWVARQPWADARRIAVLGWSHGGSAVLAATDATRESVKASPHRFAAAIAFYPGCSAPLRSGYRPAAPLTLLLGALDDWTPPVPCIALGEAVGADVQVYPDSYHDFDNPSGRLRVRTDVPNGTQPGRGVHVGPNPAARTAAYAHVRMVLRDAFGAPPR
ncbi:dienelactone hydrolase family protein [uncultured Xylophilus sp.]|uniref:dienelactone hydrolase family protein n=1 Tax=uncultured Xylophilus sp. TaxID=296832 RepID=UPI0025CE50B9|nr:dienelactone hydrolase family protein [uncultured Xylophilus sp.]